MASSSFPSLAIVGMACRFPGAGDLAAFWEMLRDGRSGIVEVPDAWMDRELYFDERRGVPGKSYCRHVGLVPPRPVNRDRCPLPDDIPATRDPFHLALVEVVADAARHAGYDPFALPSRRVGVYLGNADTSGIVGDYVYHTYADRMAGLLRELPSFGTLPRDVRSDVVRELVDGIRRDNPGITPDGLRQFTSGAAAGLVAQVLGLKGPAFAADAACASSFVAMRLAAHALACGRIDMAIVAGASIRKWYEVVMLSQIQSIGTTRSIPFDGAADGFLGADGYAAVFLKALPQALADGDRIRGVIRGIGMSTDGRGKSFWAPRKEGQILAIQRAYADGLDPSRVSFLEAHATSTQVGDATEIASLMETLGPQVHGPVPISSVKANIGHTLEVAGLAGLIKTALAMEHRTVPPAIGCDDPNPAIEWNAIPFVLPRSATTWPDAPDGRPRRAGIDSFGIGGLNTHLVLDEAPESSDSRTFVPAFSPLEPDEEDEDRDAIAVIGMGGLYPGGFTIDAYWEMLAAERDPQGSCPIERWHERVAHVADDLDVEPIPPSPAAGYLAGYEFDWKRHKIPPKQVANANPLQFLILDATEQALRDAGCFDREFDRATIGTVVGANFTGDFASDSFLGIRMPETRRRIEQSLRNRGVAETDVATIAEAYATHLLDSIRAPLDETASYNCSTHASRITKTFDLMGGAFAVDAGDASALAALAVSVDLIRSGACRMVICAAGQRALEPFRIAAIAARHGLSPTAISPVHLPTEGAGVLVLKRLADARSDGDRIRGVIRGVGVVTTFAEEIDADASDLARSGSSTDSARTEPHESAVPFGFRGGAGGMAALQKTLLEVERNPNAEDFSRPPGRTLVLAESMDDPVARGRSTWYAVVDPDAGRNRRPASTSAAHVPAMTQPASTESNAMSNASMAVERTSSSRSEPVETRSTHIPSLVRDTFLEYTGYPVALFDWDADLQASLSVNPATRRAMSDALLEACGLPKQPRTMPRAAWDSLRTLRAWHDYLVKATGSDVADSQEPLPSSVPTSVPANGSANGAAHRSESPVVAATQKSPADRFAQRFVLRSIPLDLPSDSPAAPTFHGPALIVGDDPTAEALRETLTTLGVTVHRLPIQQDAAATLVDFDRLWSAGPIPHLFLTTSRDAAAAIDALDASAWNERRSAGILTPYLVCQRWFGAISQANLQERATLAATTALGGDFGLAGHIASVESGAMTGLLKGIDIETSGKIRVRLLDAAANEPVKLIAAQLLRELAATTADVEVGMIRGRRHVLRAQRQDAGSLERRDVPQGSTWVITGGGRGVTAFVARELGRRFGLKLHLIGSTAAPDIPAEWKSLDDAGRKQLKANVLREAREHGESPEVAWSRVEKGIELARSLDEFRAAGVTATYHACDVADHAALAAMLDAIRATDGGITGVIHGAGYERAGQFQKKSLDDVDRTLAAKVDGALALMDLTRDDPLEFFVGFGSTSGRFGGFGQTDYSLANDLLCKAIDAYQDRFPTRRAFSFHWGAWGEIGMAVRPQSLSMLKLMKVGFMPPQEGADLLIEELQAATHESELLAIDHPGGFFSERVTMPTTEALAAVEARNPLVADSPLVDDFVPLAAQDGIARITCHPLADPFLNGHRHEGTPLYPAVMGIEACAQAARLASGGRTVVGLRDLKLVNGFRMALERPHRAAVRATIDGDAANCQLTGDFYDKQGRHTDPQRLFHSCTIDLADGPQPLPQVELGELPGTWEPLAYPQHWSEMRDGLGGSVFYGPELRSLREVQHFDNAIRGKHVADPLSDLGGSRRGTWLTPSALLDSLLYACDVFCLRKFAAKHLPHAIERIEFGRLPKPGEVCLSQCMISGWDGPTPTFDGWILGDDGGTILQMTNLHIVPVKATIQTALK